MCFRTKNISLNSFLVLMSLIIFWNSSESLRNYLCISKKTNINNNFVNILFYKNLFRHPKHNAAKKAFIYPACTEEHMAGLGQDGVDG